MTQLNIEINKETKRTLSELYETRFFQALTELCNAEIAVVLSTLLDKNKSESQLRFYQGRAEEVKVLLERIAEYHEEVMKEAKSQ